MGFILGLVLSLSVVVRGGFVATVPPELFGDETDVGYQALSLFKTGKDLYGQVLPTYIHSLSEWRAPVLMYATVPTIAVLGPSELGVRLPQVIFGALAPILLFLLSYQLTKNKSLSLISALLLSITPWHIYYSRAAFEVVIMLDLILVGTLTFLRRKYSLSVLFFALATYTYSTAVVFVPLWLFTLSLITRKRPTIVSLLVLGLLVSPLIFHTVAGPARDRFSLVSVFKNDEVARNVNESREWDSSNHSSVWHNKIESYSRLLLGNYLRAYSSEFLFVRGDPTHRHSIQVIGQLLPVFAPFLLFGLYYLAKRKQSLWLAWFFLAPMPSIVTNDGGYHATRLFLEVPPLVFTTSAGVYLFVKSFPRIRYLTSIFVLTLFLGYFAWVAHYYLTHYSKDSWRWWHVGFKTAMEEVEKIQANYTRVFINNSYEPALIRYLFYTNYPPAKFQKSFTLDQPKPEIVTGYNGFTLDGKIFFGSFSESPRTYLPGSLYVISQRDDVGGDWDWRTSPPGEIQVLHTSTNPFNQPVLYLVTKK